MHRRTFLGSVARAAACAGAHIVSSWQAHAWESATQDVTAGSPGRPQIALTMDDPTVFMPPVMEWPEANRRILDALETRKLKIALFVCGMRIDQPEGKRLLGAWDDAGHLICNHSYSHRDFNAKPTTYEMFAEDFVRDEPVLAPYRHRTRLFRYPGLKEGDTVEKRDGFRALLKQHGYRVGHVTIDASDWYVDDRMQQRLKRDSTALLEPYRDYLINHLLDRASYYHQLAQAVLGREIRHTLLVHYRMINALFLSDVMAAFEKNGWQWIDAKQAFEDPVFVREPKTLPAGESLVWALAAESGRFQDRLRYPGEDDGYEKPRIDALGL